MKNGDKPINPLLDLNEDKSGLWGLTKREYFAGLAMQVYINNHHSEEDYTVQFVAKCSVKIADELLKQLDK